MESSDSPSVPRLFPGQTICILGTGPSLCADDVYAVTASGTPIVAISNAIYLTRDAAVVYAPDAKWWSWHRDIATADGPLKFALQRTNYPSVTCLRARQRTGIDTDPRYLAIGGHGGWQAINLAVHLGAARIVLLGYDFQPSESGAQHFFGEHPDHSHTRYAKWLPYYRDLCPQLAALGISIVNASRQTAIDGIPRTSLLDALRPASPTVR